MVRVKTGASLLYSGQSSFEGCKEKWLCCLDVQDKRRSPRTYRTTQSTRGPRRQFLPSDYVTRSGSPACGRMAGQSTVPPWYVRRMRHIAYRSLDLALADRSQYSRLSVKDLVYGNTYACGLVDLPSLDHRRFTCHAMTVTCIDSCNTIGCRSRYAIEARMTAPPISLPASSRISACGSRSVSESRQGGLSADARLA
jgi:hypothetical protein